MLPIRNERMGGGSRPSHSVRGSIAARNKARRFLERHFEIVQKSPAEIGWQLGSDTPLKI